MVGCWWEGTKRWYSGIRTVSRLHYMPEVQLYSMLSFLDVPSKSFRPPQDGAVSNAEFVIVCKKSNLFYWKPRLYGFYIIDIPSTQILGAWIRIWNPFYSTKQVDKICGFRVEFSVTNTFWHANIFDSDKEFDNANARTG